MNKLFLLILGFHVILATDDFEDFEESKSSKALGFLDLLLNHKLKTMRAHKIDGLNSNSYINDYLDLPNDVVQVNETVKRSGYRHLKGQHCGCKANYRPFELGRQYFPRYVSVAHCEPYGCANRTHICQQKIYTIKVLRERYLDDRDELDSFLPEPLRGGWLLEDVPVAVTCECVA